MKQWMRFFAPILLCGLVALPAVGQTVYTNNFSNGAGGGIRPIPSVSATWSATNTEVTPTGRYGRFLGQFDNGTVSLTLANLPAHRWIGVNFKLFVIQSWDGNNTTFGPDFWQLSVGGGPILLGPTTFNNHIDPAQDVTPSGQSYPGNYFSAFRSKAGAMESNTLGYFFLGPQDAVYDIGRIFSHTGGSVTLNFSASNLQGIGDEGWGIDNIVVGLIR